MTVWIGLASVMSNLWHMKDILFLKELYFQDPLKHFEMCTFVWCECDFYCNRKLVWHMYWHMWEIAERMLNLLFCFQLVYTVDIF